MNRRDSVKSTDARIVLFGERNVGKSGKQILSINSELENYAYIQHASSINL